MAPAVAELKKQGYQIVSENAWESDYLSDKYQIKRVPTLVYLVNGREVKRETGGMSQDRIVDLWPKADE